MTRYDYYGNGYLDVSDGTGYVGRISSTSDVLDISNCSGLFTLQSQGVSSGGGGFWVKFYN